MVKSRHWACIRHALNWVGLTSYWCVISLGEGCVALRAAQFCYTEFHVTLTHHGERTGTLTGGIQLQTSEGKPTEKLYGESAHQLRSYLTWQIHSTSVGASVPVFSSFQISSKLKGMTLSTQKGKALITTSETPFSPSCGYFTLCVTQLPAETCSVCFADRGTITQTHDISNPSYMSYKSGNVMDKGWSYSMPPKNLSVSGHMSVRGPTGKPGAM